VPEVGLAVKLATGVAADTDTKRRERIAITIREYFIDGKINKLIIINVCKA
jgi:hypothetical protein